MRVPLLFLTYINDIKYASNVLNCFIFAFDTILSYSDKLSLNIEKAKFTYFVKDP